MGHGNLESKREPSFEANVFVSLDWHGDVLENDKSLLTFNLLVMTQHDIFFYFFPLYFQTSQDFPSLSQDGKGQN